MPAKHGKVSMLGTFSVRDKIILCSLNAIALVECSMSMESWRNLILCLLYRKKKASKRGRKFTVTRRRARRRGFENLRKYQALVTGVFLLLLMAFMVFKPTIHHQIWMKPCSSENRHLR